MSTTDNQKHIENSSPTYIKIENDSDDELTCNNISESHMTVNYISCFRSTSINSTKISSAYKGKIEVTSKGRRKIFDGVRWQILCRRPDCRKQTNKKSLCITHYKEEYESNNKLSCSPINWTKKTQTFQIPSYQSPQSTSSTVKTRTEIEDGNNTISTTNETQTDEQSINSSSDKLNVINEMRYLVQNRTSPLKTSKWLRTSNSSDFENSTRKLAYESFRIYQNTHREPQDSHTIDEHHCDSSNESITHEIPSLSCDSPKRAKINEDYSIYKSPFTDQFHINGNGVDITPINVNRIKYPVDSTECFAAETTSKKSQTTMTSDTPSLVNRNNQTKFDQSVQTELTIPLCCIIHQNEHSFYSLCDNGKSTSSTLLHDTKVEPNSHDTNVSI